MKQQLIYNAIQTPDGTVLVSRHRHDFVQYTDKNKQYYAVDGGNDYQRILFDKMDFKDLSIWSDDSFEKIRENYCRGGRGKDGKQPLIWVPLSKMSNSWLEACIDYNNTWGMKDSFANEMYNAELIYREFEGIVIED
jgi:hypothetical protein